MPDLTEKQTFSDQEALDFHRIPTPGKISMAPTKPMATMVTMTPATSVHLREASHATMAKARMTSSQGAADSTFSKKINARDSG